MAGFSALPTTVEELRDQLNSGQTRFPGLRLGEIDGVDLDLAGCDLHGGCFKEARFGHACLAGTNIEGCCFQQSLIWGADLSGVLAQGSSWHSWPSSVG